MLWTAIGIGGIWAAVVLISLLSPDMVSGSEQEHQKVAAFTSWFWGGVGTLVFLWGMGRLRGDAMWRPTWIGLSIVTFGGLGARDDQCHRAAGRGNGLRPDADPGGRGRRAGGCRDAHRDRRRGHERVPPRPWSPLKGGAIPHGERQRATHSVPALPNPLSIRRSCST